MKRPPYLKKGDVVAIVATASAIRDGIEQGVQVLEGWGLIVRVGSSTLKTWNTFAGTDEQRRADLQAAMDDPEIKAVFAARGGYGSVRIIDAIQWSGFTQYPKWVIGFSDITVLHSHIQRHTGVASIHGQMPKTFEEGTQESITSLRDLLFGTEGPTPYETQNPYNRPGTAEGIIIGGNLAILQSIIASPSDPIYADKILFLEDVGEALYNIDRMMWTLKRAGKLHNLRGMIVGQFTGLRDSDPPYGHTIEEILSDITSEFHYPIVFDFPAGHIPDNRPLLFGCPAIMNVTDKHMNLTYI